MDNSTKWLRGKMRTGWILLVGGLLVAVAGILVPRFVGNLPFRPQIFTALGVLLIGAGVAQIVPYAALKNDQPAARRYSAEQRDERSQLLRVQASYRASRVAAILTIGGLMWVSIASFGGLPQLSPDALWYFLAAVVVIPFVVYIGSLIYDEQHY
jgi:hypothetical protein